MSSSTSTASTSPSTTSNALTTLFSSLRKNRSMSPIIKRLMALRVNVVNNNNNDNGMDDSNLTSDEQQRYAEKAIRSLVKKLKRGSSIEELERAISLKNSGTKCVCIQRSLDGRLQIQQHKSNAVVIYCKLFRWPDLTSHNELKPMDHCIYAYHYRKDDLCINPYHYERVPATYSVYVPRLPMGAIPELKSSMMDEYSSGQIPENTTYQPLDQSQSPLSSSFAQSPSSISSQDSPGISSDDGSCYHDPLSTSMSMDIGGYEPTSNPQHTVTSTTASSPHVSGASNTAASTNFLSSVLLPLNNGSNHLPQQQQQIYATSNGGTPTPLAYEQVPFEEPHEWCHISYYEMSNRVGEQFRATQPHVVIDGFTDPSNADRFCLGLLTNVHRTFEIDKARRFIGRGVRLYHIRGDVYAECISDNPVFVQSPICNQRYSWHQATVCKIPPTRNLKIFDSADFTRTLHNAISEGYEAVWHLTKMCIIRMSFVKGWGVEYRRQAVTCTPCWVEIHLDGPLKWLDNVLQHMRGPTQSITSVS
ncbi:unnamed protein product [Didymodactylos carnosus]|uniref:Mothers against decapentaplegic homolog n=1 Tax=Didymodactylos carnosus TaxID=1234261 RepID=A0A813SCX4_9BILA|nr:unnamed protein product [Didymodactylos carnosus]CAF0835913.1 unnamed protein product [Didymodactylos carnosus]CAF3582361.1 unnamed protein product [Didymodactylos carnosus]CAF3620657.1 unnamed protein product [Didymodactylos carnosus]